MQDELYLDFTSIVFLHNWGWFYFSSEELFIKSFIEMDSIEFKKSENF